MKKISVIFLVLCLVITAVSAVTPKEVSECKNQCADLRSEKILECNDDVTTERDGCKGDFVGCKTSNPLNLKFCSEEYGTCKKNAEEDNKQCIKDSNEILILCNQICNSIKEYAENEWAPVCGTDGVTYANPYTLAMKGVKQAYEGICTVESCNRDLDCPNYYCLKGPCPENTCIEGKCVAHTCGNDICEAGEADICTTPLHPNKKECISGTCSKDCSHPTTRDIDHDGYPLSEDCNDNNASINPGAIEKCNGVDDNCDGIIDEENALGCTVYYKDVDRDTFGNVLDSKCLCTPTAEYNILISGDCNDNNASINPGAIELCNGIDDNCDGTIDEENATGCLIYYEDVDSDTYGNSNNKCLCAAKGNYDATRDSDCNDNDETINPGKTEIPYNGKDDDCNPTTPDDDLDNDGYPIETDCNDNNASINPGAIELCNGVDDNCDGTIDEENATGCLIYYEDADSDTYGNINYKCLCKTQGDYTAITNGDCNDNDETINPGKTEIPYNGKDDDCNPTTPDDDLDNDGYPIETDCNDNNASINPGATEQCNGVDDNCDGTIDEENATGCLIYYEDVDSDTYGNINYKCLCKTQGDYTAITNGDCNDNNAAVNPSATETCNGIDDNCDGIIDEENAQGCNTYYLDEDQDTYGVNITKCLCTANGNYTATRDSDCNDLNAEVNPGARELCNGIDDNCDGIIDEGLTQACGSEGCNGTQTCELGTWGQCSTSEQDCGTCCTCSSGTNPTETYDSTQVTDCRDNNYGVLSVCDNTPDGKDYTLDTSAAFTSTCSGLETCTTQARIWQSSCNKETCGAQCETNNDCPPTECDTLDKCYDGTYRDYTDETNTCNLETCGCSQKSCTTYIEKVTDADGDGYDTECDGDCDDTNALVNPGMTEIPGNGIDDDCNLLTSDTTTTTTTTTESTTTTTTTTTTTELPTTTTTTTEPTTTTTTTGETTTTTELTTTTESTTTTTTTTTEPTTTITMGPV